MKNQALQITAKDFGLVIARALAILTWYEASTYALRIIGIGYSMFAYRPFSSRLGSLEYLGILLPILVFFGLAFVGQRLWVEAERFGGEGQDAVAPVSLSRTMLLQGFSAAMGIYFAARATFLIAPFIVSAVAPGPTFRAPAGQSSNLGYAIVYAGFAIGLISWTARSLRPDPEEFVDEPPE